MKRAAVAALSAFAYFTVIPMGRFATLDAPDALALSFLPLVGIFVGAVTGIAAAATLHFAGNPWQAIVALVLSIVLTGAVHVDGFLDCCDGLLVTAAPQRRLEILKDPRHGTYAVAGMVLLAVVWLQALRTIPGVWLVPALVFAAAIARLSVIPNAWIFPYARAGAMSRSFESRPSVVIVALFCAFALATYAYFGAAAPIALALTMVSALVVGRFAAQRLGGGLTGDVYGAIIVINEVLALIVLGGAFYIRH